MSSIKPFKIHVPDEKLDRLKQKLLLTDFPSEVSDAEPWSRGPPISDIKRIVNHWLNDYDWRRAETHLNTFAHYTTDIAIDNYGTYNVHFIHETSKIPNAIPLLFVHGWPGSFEEVTKILPLLLQGDKDYPSFHVVAPSLIDFGFSDAAGKKGFNVDQHAETCHKLMLQLGYNEYVTQGGDAGYHVTRKMAQVYPQHVRAQHYNGAICNPPADSGINSPGDYATLLESDILNAREKAGLRRSFQFQTTGMGYFAIQGTKPNSISMLLNDSPAGLLTWIYDALYNWSDWDNYHWTDDEIITWVSIYYFSKPGVAASVRIYYEETARKPLDRFKECGEYADVPFGVAFFPEELGSLPRAWLKGMGPVVHQSEWDAGGHFAAWERPKDLVSDLRVMFGKSGGAEGVVKGKSGYEE